MDGHYVFAANVPIDGDQIIIVSPTELSPWAYNDSLWIGNTGNATLLIQDGGIVSTISASYIGRLLNGVGLVEVSGSGSQFTIGNNSSLTMGYSSGSNGSLLISDGGVVSNGSGVMGYSTGSTGTVNVFNGGTWNTVTVQVGYNGNGTLMISDNSVVNSTGLGLIADGIGSTGAVDVSSGGWWNIAQSLYVGRKGYGTLSIHDGGVVNNSGTANISSVVIGSELGSTGIAEVFGEGSQWNTIGTLDVGSSGAGTLKVSDGGVVSNTNSYIGHYAGSTGVVEIFDGGEWHNNGSLYAGYNSDGKLTISNGGIVSSKTGYLSYNDTAQGLVDVTGVGSQWNNSGAIYVGYYGSGKLTISDGGIVKDTIGYIARNSAAATVEVSNGGLWDNSSLLSVGNSGNGLLKISNGGMVNSLYSVISAIDTSTSVVDVSGVGSQWNNADTLTIGQDGNGTLTIADQAVVSASTVALAKYATSSYTSSGTLNIGNGNLAGTLNTASITGEKGSATVNFNHTDAIDFSPIMSGTLAVNHLTGGTTRLLAVNNYTGATNISAGTLQAGATNAFSAASNYTVDTAGQLDLAGYNQTLTSLSNAGVVSLNGAPGTVLTVTGNYVGNNGLLNFNTVLNDDTSATDKLVVNGNTSGTTKVSVTNAGGSGVQTLNGIELVQVNGISDGEFVKNGRIVAGAFDYSLARGTGTNTNHWYLTSALSPVIPEPELSPEPDETTPPTMIERPEVAGYSANLAAANNMFVTRLHDRLGETQYIDALTGEPKVTSMWLRNEGGHTRSRDNQDQLGTQANRYVLQLGGDIAQWSQDDMDRFHLGVMAGYGNSKSKTESQISGYSARASVDGYSLGMYGTWYANEADKSGWYVDSWVQYSWFNNTVDGQYLNTEKYKSKGITASIESGYTFKIAENSQKNASYFIQPKAQMTWMGVKADNHRETNGTNVSGEGDGNIQTRLGVKAFMNGFHESSKGKDRVFQPFIEANWIHNSKDFGTQMDGISVKQAGAGNIGELKTGVEGQINKQLNVWGNVSQQIGGKGYSDSAVMLGVKYSF
ncbi:autotransporter outer membrane beta-barrel domain-containing protein [Yersinia alsatica]|uniref:autotransporter outer membrane beta-barrel domain-containing protein n=1 Tax=Yersinia alsatica TaxID=2890317 RepID=UPI001643D1BD|nr:autotransporter outer membrane beta-barrel domain-containing protein [Yersinia alsatica]